MDKTSIINYYSIIADNNKLPKIIFKSDEKTSKDVKSALLLYATFWDDIQRDFHQFPTVITTIYCKNNASLDNFLDLPSVRSAFENNLKKYNTQISITLISGNRLSVEFDCIGDKLLNDLFDLNCETNINPGDLPPDLLKVLQNRFDYKDEKINRIITKYY